MKSNVNLRVEKASEDLEVDNPVEEESDSQSIQRIKKPKYYFLLMLWIAYYSGPVYLAQVIQL